MEVVVSKGRIWTLVDLHKFQLFHDLLRPVFLFIIEAMATPLWEHLEFVCPTKGWYYVIMFIHKFQSYLDQSKDQLYITGNGHMQLLT